MAKYEDADEGAFEERPRPLKRRRRDDDDYDYDDEDLPRLPRPHEDLGAVLPLAGKRQGAQAAGVS